MLSKNKIKAGLYVMAVLWTVWIIYKNFDNYLDNYITIIVLQPA